MNLILIGLRGSGKTSVGRLVAERLGRGYCDLDLVVAGRLQSGSAGEAWRTHGEVAFRLMELEVLREVLTQDGRVLALGGGTPTAPGAADLLVAERDAGRAMIIYLTASAYTLRARLVRTDISTRPSLTGDSPLAEIEAVLAARDARYRKLADFMATTDAMSIEETANHVVALMQGPRRNRHEPKRPEP